MASSTPFSNISFVTQSNHLFFGLPLPLQLYTFMAHHLCNFIIQVPNENCTWQLGMIDTSCSVNILWNELLTMPSLAKVSLKPLQGPNKLIFVLVRTSFIPKLQPSASYRKTSHWWSAYIFVSTTIMSVIKLNEIIMEQFRPEHLLHRMTWQLQQILKHFHE